MSFKFPIGIGLIALGSGVNDLVNKSYDKTKAQEINQKYENKKLVENIECRIKDTKNFYQSYKNALIAFKINDEKFTVYQSDIKKNQIANYYTSENLDNLLLYFNPSIYDLPLSEQEIELNYPNYSYYQKNHLPYKFSDDDFIYFVVRFDSAIKGKPVFISYDKQTLSKIHVASQRNTSEFSEYVVYENPLDVLYNFKKALRLLHKRKMLYQEFVDKLENKNKSFVIPDDLKFIYFKEFKYYDF